MSGAATAQFDVKSFFTDTTGSTNGVRAEAALAGLTGRPHPLESRNDI
jgi:hypothetical protein